LRDINLLPDEKKLAELPTPSTKIKYDNSIKSGLIGFFIILFMATTILAPKIFIKELEDRQNSIAEQLTAQKYIQAKALNSQLDNINAKLEFKKKLINTIDTTSYPVSELLNILKRAQPEASTINSFEYSSGSLKISISMEDLTQISEFISNIKRSDYLKPSASMKDLTINKDSSLQFTFDVGRKEGK
jgi:hypothetical protein